MEIEATVTDKFSFEKKYPKFYNDTTGHCTKLVTDSGELLVYWNTITTLEDAVQKGDRLRFKATIKKHGTDKEGRKETTLSRVLKAVRV